jgi:hypothetical protein
LTIESSGDKFVGQVRDHAERGQMKLSNLEDIKSAWEKETMNSTLRASSLSFRIFAVRASCSSAVSLKSLSVDVNRSDVHLLLAHTERERECESEKLIERKRGLGRERDKSRETEFGDREQQAGSWDLKRCRPYTQEVDTWSHLTLCYGCCSDLNCFPCDMSSDVHDVKSQHERDRKCV